ncbi:MAG: ParM/StbA family protein [Candidatus Anstonellales archaeon]
MSFVAIDLGASSTRFVSTYGKISIIPNNMVFLGNEKVDLEPYDESIEASLEVIIEKEGESEIFPARVLVGQLAERYSSTNERPSVIANKHVQRINYVSGVIATAISKLMYGFNSDIHLYVALPPIEVKTAKDIVRERFIGNYTVTFPKYKGGTQVKFTISEVSCYEESFMSLVSYFFDMNGQVREKSKVYMKGNILSLDIGASTTDLAIVKDGKYLDKSGQTYKTGGNIARDYLIDAIRAQYGFDLPLGDAEVAMAEGRLQLGNTYVDISDIVEQAKRAFASSVVSQMQGYFRQVNIPIQTIRAIIVSGGGSIESQYIDDNGNVVKTSKPMSEYITEFLKEICPTVEVENHLDNPRLANIMGLFIRAKLNEKKAGK